ncbi:hypothetical protein PIB30_090468 [Stylosanthes scabra]|uniref:Uncharacterized protein n=1 Tax=Stylosanthes scabra TaxID=79078 RepID=A0ABU6ZSW5_9FABA|nr:hypothetical protein [Stylosanthes scabra]
MPTFYLSSTLDRKWDNLTTLVEISAQVTNNEFEEEEEETLVETSTQVTNNEFELEEEEGHDGESILIESYVEVDENSRTTNKNLSVNNTLDSSSSSSSSYLRKADAPCRSREEEWPRSKNRCGDIDTKAKINVEGLDDNDMKETEMNLGQWNTHKKKDKNGKDKKASVMYVLNGKQWA